MSVSASAPRARGQRLFALDGMRGVAAVIVFAHHALVLLKGPLAGVNEGHWVARPAWAIGAMHTLPVAWLFNGGFAVSFFFVLSGFVLRRALGPDPSSADIARNVAARFLRLLPLVLLGTAFGWLVFDQALAALDALEPLTGNNSHAFISEPLIAAHGPLVALRQAFVAIWRGALADQLLDPPLWSIGLELQGSLLVYLLTGAMRTVPQISMRVLVGMLTGTALMGLDAAPFIVGMALAEHNVQEPRRLLKVSPVALVGLLALTLTWASIHPWDRQLWLPLPIALPLVAVTALNTAGAAIVLAAGLQLGVLARLFEGRLCQWLGRASYGLYVVHVPILYLLTAPLLRLLNSYVPPPFVSFGVAGALLLLCLVVGDLLITKVDTPLAARSRRWCTELLTSGTKQTAR